MTAPTPEAVREAIDRSIASIRYEIATRDHNEAAKATLTADIATLTAHRSSLLEKGGPDAVPTEQALDGVRLPRLAGNAGGDDKYEQSLVGNARQEVAPAPLEKGARLCEADIETIQWLISMPYWARDRQLIAKRFLRRAMLDARGYEPSLGDDTPGGRT